MRAAAAAAAAAAVASRAQLVCNLLKGGALLAVQHAAQPHGAEAGVAGIGVVLDRGAAQRALQHLRRAASMAHGGAVIGRRRTCACRQAGAQLLLGMCRRADARTRRTLGRVLLASRRCSGARAPASCRCRALPPPAATHSASAPPRCPAPAAGRRAPFAAPAAAACWRPWRSARPPAGWSGSQRRGRGTRRRSWRCCRWAAAGGRRRALRPPAAAACWGSAWLLAGLSACCSGLLAGA